MLESESFDLALFKSAWCDWKLGETEKAAKRFKLVLDLAAEAERSGTEAERKRRSQLRDEALDYLVLVFTEDPNIRTLLGGNGLGERHGGLRHS